ncbi:IclR family transcriptional regulator [Nonomuraea gerenzanensis]|uniref:Transcriptional regulator, IclR family n=1 Tax=Nonomuraea gerenzanensis TaxID=93944 RepID=A0A1M4EJZ7_9ACTN|nr:IclR family transcriptional regulator [Nonomuraea gerenzanensis]UBU10491.1 IclR family transcriptional regulator [Nonomuraea gerenzanensis]SBO98893.1 Transcriptional regulator, IclR family [Nonomuraea gerenzanensis]
MKNRPPYALGSVDNALLVLHMLRDRGRVQVTDVAGELGIARSTAHRLLAMLVYRDFAVQDEQHTYLPGPFLASTPAVPGGSALRELRARTRPAMEALCARVQETVNLVVRVGAEVRFLDSVESAQLLHVGDRRGTILPAHLASGGKALLADLPPEELWDLYEHLPARDRAVLTHELAEVRARGHALNIEGTEQGVSAIGAALRNGRGTAVGAFSISVPSARFDADRVATYTEELRRAVSEAELRLIGFPD